MPRCSRVDPISVWLGFYYGFRAPQHLPAQSRDAVNGASLTNKVILTLRLKSLNKVPLPYTPVDKRYTHPSNTFPDTWHIVKTQDAG